MMYYHMSAIVKAFFLALAASIAVNAGSSKATCKATPGSRSWPSLSDWQKLNNSVSGRLIQPSPPGAVCHPGQPTYDEATCAAVQVLWYNSTFHADNPISVDYVNWNNDSCFPYPQAPCSGAGYPVYVVNASTAQQVKAGIDFARKNNIRLIVKTSGHDLLGRSSAPNSLSIWVRYMGGLSLSPNFQPKGCNYHLNESSITVGAGVLMEEIHRAAAAHNLAVVGGMAQDIGIGGYLTGGGHNAISPTYGLGADGVLEMEVVTPSGDILIANECHNSDVFWALRGGGGSTFGVITSATLRTFATPKMGWVQFALQSPEAYSDAFWNTTTYLFQQIPRLVEAGVSGYLYALPAIAGGGPNGTLGAALYGGLAAVNKPASAITTAFEPIVAYANSAFPRDITFQTNATEYASFFDWWFPNRDSSPVGVNVMIGSRLLNADVLSVPFGELKQTLKTAAGPLGFSGIMVAGKGVWDAKPRGGSDSVNPAWRNGTVVHLTTGVSWPPLNTTAMEYELGQLERQVGALRKLAPYSGAYVNEADPNEPKYQHTFWGSNYPRLLRIKKELDPGDVFWCHPCVGDEGWKEEGANLCRV